MANTKSAERRARSSQRKRLRNRGVKSRLRKLEKQYLATLSASNKEAATKAFRDVSSALDKAAKAGVIHRSAASRKKSRLAFRLNAVQ